MVDGGYAFVHCLFTLDLSALCPPLDTPSQRVQFLLGAEDDDEEHLPHDLFTEMDEICQREGEDCEWKESARYWNLSHDYTQTLHTFVTYCKL